jgi:hypothetical protein
MHWRTYIINGREFYAPDLLNAFHQARIDGFGSQTLTCTGSREGR